MLEVLTDFVEELRLGGLPVSPREAVDAARAASVIALNDRSELKNALRATLVKSAEHVAPFDSTFDIFFAIHADLSRLSSILGELRAEQDDDESGERDHSVRSISAVIVDEEMLAEMMRSAILSGDAELLVVVARNAVALHSGIEPGRPVGVSYYLYRTIRALGLDDLLSLLLANIGQVEDEMADDLVALTKPLGSLGERLLGEEYLARAEELRKLIETEIKRLLVNDRGSKALQSSQRKGALSDIDFMHATREELVELRKALGPLTRKLAVKLARRRKHLRKGALDFRATIRRSLSTGGVPIEPRFHSTHPSKPEIFVIADISGSVASFARFTLQLVYALDSQFSKVRSFVFVDGIDEITQIFRRSSTIAEAIERLGREADFTHFDGHSDYGHAFSIFQERWGKEITSKTNVIILGDARNNYHPAETWTIEQIRRRARHVYWLNPEPRAYWGSGDSIVEQYGRHCSAVVECRNLRHLEAFVERLQ